MRKLVLSLLLVVGAALSGGAAMAEDGPDAVTRGTFQGLLPVVHFDVSPPLRDMVPLIPLPRIEDREKEEGEVREIEDDFDTGIGVPGTGEDFDPFRQTTVGEGSIPAPLVSFNAQTNIAGVSPPDPVGDVGPNHYVAMSNLHFQIFDKAGNSVFGPAASNTLWAGFGGDCQNENDGDPVVLYDQIHDRWILTQFTANAVPFLNCVAVSQTPDPTGAYYRYAIQTGTSGGNFPDYPKYGIWLDGLYISTREFLGGSGGAFQGIGEYAINLPQLIAGNPTPEVIFFIVPPGAAPYNIGDGLLPADVDGTVEPPAGSPEIYMGSMDNGSSTGAPQDALTFWKFHVDWGTPANSTFTLTHTLPIAPFDTIFPCTPGSRDCISQPGTTQKIDILSYRQRPLNRLAYRNFGDHEALVTNQSVEAAAGVAGIRWWEIRDLGTTPTVFQEGTYAPSDGVQRWMASAAMDEAGNMALGFSASNGTSVFPSVRYTGRLAGDPAGTMGLGEGEIVAGTGSQTGSARWGDYSSLNVDPIDDCTFWYVNEFVPTNGSAWRLRVGAFKFDQCGDPDYYIGSSAPQAVCAGADAVYSVPVGSISNYSDDVTLATSNLPTNATSSFAPNPVTPPGSSTLTVGTTGVASGDYAISVDGTSTSGSHSQNVSLSVYATTGASPALVAPANGATDQLVRPLLTWSAAALAKTYELEIATDAGFSNVVYSANLISGTSHTVTSSLAPLTQHFWHVRSTNPCGSGPYSSAFSFTTRAIPPTLLVDDDGNSPDVGAMLSPLLTTADEPFDVWTTGGNDTSEPTLADLMPYKRVIWFSGDLFGTQNAGPAGPGTSGASALASWLDLNTGNCLVLDSQDYLFDHGITSFGTNYLGVGSVNHDRTNTSLAGRNFFSALGTLALSYPAGYSNFNDVLTAASTATLGASFASGGSASGLGNIYKDNVVWKTVFLTAGPEVVSGAANQQAMFDRLLEYCDAIFQDNFDTTNFNRWSSHVP